MTKKYFSVVLLSIIFIFTSCKSDDDSYIPIEQIVQVSPVNLDLNLVPYPNLSDYNFFEGNMNELLPVYGVLPYKLSSGLFIDYANAKTFVWMPEGSSAKYVNDYSMFDYPEGTVLITTHYFENVLPSYNSKMIETRLLIYKESEWLLVNYVWNDEQTEASFTTDGGFVSVDFVRNDETISVNYRIPSYSECFTCHNKYEVITPIGPKPQNLNHNYTFSDGEQNQLSKWAEFGYLDNDYPSNIESTVNWADTSQPLDLRVRSYLDINCAHCHSDQGYCDYRSMRFAFNRNEEFVNRGVCVEPDTQIGDENPFIVNPGNANGSVLFLRISSTQEQERMPILGRTVQHVEGVALIEEWINSLTDRCN